MDLRKLKPLRDLVLVEQIEEAHPFGLVVIKNDPRSVDSVGGDYRRTILKGKVLAIGSGKRMGKGWVRPLSVKKGDVVLFSDWNDWEEAPRGHYMIEEGDILGKVQHG